MIGSTLKDLGKQTAIYSFGDAFVKSLSFLLLPILVRVWDPNGPDMGVYGLLHLAEAVTYLIFNMGLTTAVIKVVSDYKQSRSRASAAFTAIGLLGTISLGMLALWLAAAPGIAVFLFGDGVGRAEGILFLRLTFIATYFSTYRFILFSLLRVERRSVLYVFLNIINFITYVSVAIYLVVVEEMGVLGIVYSNLTASIVMLALALALLQKRCHRPFSGKKARDLLSFGLPLLPNGLALSALALLDRWLLRELSPGDIGLALTGQYDVAYRLGMIVSFLLIVPLRTAWVPILFSVKDHPDAPRLYGRLITYVVAFGGAIALGLGILAPEIISVITEPGWYAAAAPLPVIAFAYLAYGVSQVADAGILARNRTSVYPLISLTSVVINVSLCILLIPSHGMMGAAWATLVAYLWHMLMVGRVSHSISPFILEWKRLTVLIVMGIVVWVGASLVPDWSLLARIAAKSVLLACYPLLLLMFGFLSTDERDAISRFCKMSSTREDEEVLKKDEVKAD